MDIDHVIMRWSQTKEEMDVLQKKIDKYKKQVKIFLVRNSLTKYESGNNTVTLSNRKHSGITKKSVPDDVWNRYAVTKDVEYLLLSKKRQKTKQLQEQSP